MSANGEKMVVIQGGTLIDGNGNAPAENDSLVI